MVLLLGVLVASCGGDEGPVAPRPADDSAVPPVREADPDEDTSGRSDPGEEAERSNDSAGAEDRSERSDDERSRRESEPEDSEDLREDSGTIP